jgi:hypothetical protein
MKGVYELVFALEMTVKFVHKLSNVDKESKAIHALWTLKLMNGFVSVSMKILNFFLQRKYALQHFAVTQPLKFQNSIPDYSIQLPIH